ncbi:MAG: flagellar hook capping protein [Alphaproteobacteria bacterium]|jgi:flagellar basal-body rod modification protein FlgD|nr:flagellar hook capping protein [Alphaproteobacteria bacterium]
MTDFSALSQAAGAAARSQSQPDNAAAASRTSLGSNFDTFLRLLTAQIQNQDPLAPMDATQFTQQLVQFSQVEQQIRTNEQMEALVTATRASQTAGALTYLGRMVEIDSDVAGVLTAGDDVSWEMAFSEPAMRATARVHDASGRIIFEQSLGAQAGRTGFAWDGTTTAGNPAPAGVYRLSIAATNAEGTAIAPAIRVNETVTGVSFDERGTPVFITPGGTRGFDAIRAIRAN